MPHTVSLQMAPAVPIDRIGNSHLRQLSIRSSYVDTVLFGRRRAEALPVNMISVVRSGSIADQL
ncbi:MAG: hypothetical protein ACJ8F3_00245 [Xanthobacteraceae bacterium]